MEARINWLREFGCDEMQGYLYAKPMGTEALMACAMVPSS